MSSRSTTIFTIAGVSVLSGLLAYAVYFDYKRRNDVEFRKKLRKEKKKASKEVPKPDEPAAQPPIAVTEEELRAALTKIRQEELPATPEAKEAYFMSQVNMGEQLCMQGPAFHIAAALSFFRALRVYPSPVELIMIYQKTVPEPVFKLVIELTNLDVKSLVEDYYNVFPAKNMNVSVKSISVEGSQAGKKILIAEKDFAAGDIIYKEEPIVTTLDLDLQGIGSHCGYCLRTIQKDMAIKPEDDQLQTVYCSKDCQVKSKAQSDNLLFGLQPVLPPELDETGASSNKEARDAAQKKFVQSLKDQGKNAPFLVARFVARQVSIETGKMVPKKPGSSAVDLPKLIEGEHSYSLYDHIERLRFLDANVDEKDNKALCEVLGAALPGLENSLTEERHATYLGKISYNSYGICFSGGRDDRPVSDARPEDLERTRTPYGTSRQIGSGLYLVSSYIQHSCAPTARPSFSSGTSELHLIASQPLKKGDEITVAYVDVTQHPDESPDESRRRRRIELARGWRFKCECTKCAAELSANGGDASESDDVEVGKDESKVDKAVERMAEAEASGVSLPTFLPPPDGETASTST